MTVLEESFDFIVCSELLQVEKLGFTQTFYGVSIRSSITFERKICIWGTIMRKSRRTTLQHQAIFVRVSLQVQVQCLNMCRKALLLLSDAFSRKEKVWAENSFFFWFYVEQLYSLYAVHFMPHSRKDHSWDFVRMDQQTGKFNNFAEIVYSLFFSSSENFLCLLCSKMMSQWVPKDY